MRDALWLSLRGLSLPGMLRKKYHTGEGPAGRPGEQGVINVGVLSIGDPGKHK